MSKLDTLLQSLLGGVKRLLGTAKPEKIKPAAGPRPNTGRPHSRRNKYSGPRVVVFIDGSNLDVSIRKLDNDSLQWCDLKKLSLKLIDGKDYLEEIRFYSAPPKYLHSSVVDRYSKYVEALKKRGLMIIEGNYKSRDRKVNITQANMGWTQESGEFAEDHELTKELRDRSEPEKGTMSFRYSSHEEKETDVNIALDMLDYAHNGKYEKCILISGDTDFNPVIDRVLNHSSNIRVVVAAPPDQRRNIRDSQQKRAHTGRRSRKELTQAILEECLLPERIRDGITRSSNGATRRSAGGGDSKGRSKAPHRRRNN